jgi:hypothetical protein|tara:strand:+ start:1796 stop:2197 length:402 start_codon:yes stop_codon:yes gene_type:complete
MKKLIIVLALFVLQGCAIIDSYNMAKFDNNEYYIINQIRTTTSLGEEHCGTKYAKPLVNSLWIKVNEFNNYSASIPNNEQTIKMSEALKGIAKGLHVKYDVDPKVSKLYCTIKFDLLNKNAITIQNVVGGKPR